MGGGDITTRLLVPFNLKAQAKIVSKEGGIISGLDIAKKTFKLVDSRIRFVSNLKDGNRLRPGTVVACIYGPAGKILAAERTALNILARLSGIATNTRRFIEKVKPYKRIKIFDTRKTTPNLRILERYAVRVGGGFNHRMNLSDGILIKDNHIEILHLLYGNKGFLKLIERMKKRVAKKVNIEIEVSNLKEFNAALEARPYAIMLDNMNLGDIKKAVALRERLRHKISGNLPKLEVSGGITLSNVLEFAKTGVDMISIGSLTHSVESLDLALEIEKLYPVRE